MATLRIPLRAGGPCGARLVTQVNSVSATLTAVASVEAPTLRLRHASAELAAEAQVMLSALRMHRTIAELSADAQVQARALRLRRQNGVVDADAQVSANGQVWLPLQPDRTVRHRRYDRAAFHQMLLDLLPRGRAWPRDGQDGALMLAWAAELERIEQRGWQLFEEWDPRTTNELFTDWEAFFELPGTGTEEQRRRELIAEWLAGGTLSREDIEGLLERLGVVATVDYWKPFIVGQSSVGDHLNTDGYSTWIVHVLNPDHVDLAWLQDYLRRLAPAGDYVHVVAAP
jgi:uncharacterized protein YmfQ (DUF2313 family)